MWSINVILRLLKAVDSVVNMTLLKATIEFLGWGGWLEIWRVKLISTQIVVEVEVGVELGNNKINTL